MIRKIIHWVNTVPFHKLLLYGLSIVLLSAIIEVSLEGPSYVDNYKPKPGPIDTRKYAKDLYNDGSIPIKKVPDLPNTIRVQVVNGTRSQGIYDIEMDFEELMYQLGIDPEDIIDYIGD